MRFASNFTPVLWEHLFRCLPVVFIEKKFGINNIFLCSTVVITEFDSIGYVFLINYWKLREWLQRHVTILQCHCASSVNLTFGIVNRLLYIQIFILKRVVQNNFKVQKIYTTKNAICDEIIKYSLALLFLGENVSFMFQDTIRVPFLLSNGTRRATMYWQLG